MLCLLYTAVAVCLYNCPKSTVQLYRQGKGVAIDDEGACLCFYKDISSLVQMDDYNYSDVYLSV